MKRTFHIAADSVAESDVLLCEFSNHHICLARADAGSKKLKALSYYELRNLLEPEKLLDVLKAEDLPDNTRMIVSSAFKNTMVMPASQFSDESARQVFTATFGGREDILYYNELSNYNAVVVHAVPQGFMDILKSSEDEVKHIFACSLQASGAMTEPLIRVHFTSKEIYVTAVREEQLKLAQTYCYTAPLDVVYYLLLICEQCGFLQSDTAVVLSGLISEDSAMYSELHHYFSQLRFWKPAAKTGLQSEHPPHFFSSIYNLAVCAL